MPTNVEFFYDIGSPYAYIASTHLEAFAQKHDVTFVWRPFLLGAVFKSTNNRMPASVPAKARWMFQDLRTWAKMYEVDFRFPSALFPANSLPAMRAIVAAQAHGKHVELSQALFARYWTKEQDPASPEVLMEAAAEVGLDGGQLAEMIGNQAIKDKLRANTEEAVERGAFGAPTFFVDGDKMMLWGNDRFMQLEWYLKQAQSSS